MKALTHGSLFSGIDGFSLAARWMGWQNLFTCEKDDFCNRVLKHYEKDIPHYEDIRNTDFTVWRGRIDVLTGGFPCQPYSVAGKRLGKEDDRHLWPEMLRAIRECSPRWVVGENVRGIISWSRGLVFDEVQSDLEALGYEVTPYVLPACAVNAPHRRDRVWFIAHAKSDGMLGEERDVCETDERQNRELLPELDITGYGFVQKGSTTHRSDTGVESLQSGRKAGFSESKVTTDTHSTGFQEKGPKQQTTGSSRVSLSRAIADTGSFLRKSRGTDGSRKEKNATIGTNVFIESERFGEKQFVADTASEGYEEWEQSGRRKNSKEITRGMELRDKRYGDYGDVTNPDSNERLKRRMYPNRPESTERYIGTRNTWGDGDTWANFPTQSPVRIGNDGISTELLRCRLRELSNGLLGEKEINKIISKAVTKLRTESIKAGGNSVVVPLVFHIFKAIDQWEKTYSNRIIGEGSP